MLDDVVAALDLPPAVYIGNSVGGFCAARLAITQPKRVAGLVLVDTGGFLGNPLTNAYSRLLGVPAVLRRVLPRFVGSYLHAESSADHAVPQRVLQRAGTADGVALAAALWRSFAVPEANLRSQAHRITARTLLVWGSKDTAIPVRFGRRRPAPTAHARGSSFRGSSVTSRSRPATRPPRGW